MEQPIIANGGVQCVPQIAVQYVYLDFDGELTSYNGEILTVDGVEVLDSSLTEERIACIVAELNEKYASQNVVFVTERPESVEYSTIYIGKTNAFDEYGSFAGLAETIDEGNQIKNDNAFVMLDFTATDAEIISSISHETDHLLGTLNHGGEGLAAYAAKTIIGAGTISSGFTITSGNSVVISSGGTANDVIINSKGTLHISRAGYANHITAGIGCSMYVASGGIALNIIESGGYVNVNPEANVTFIPTTINGLVLSNNSASLNSGTEANNAKITSGGNLYLKGGVANSTTINSSGTMWIQSGSANNTIVNSWGYLFVSRGSATNIVASSGARLGIVVASDTYVQGTYAGSAFEMKDATLNNFTIKDNLNIYVSSGGTINNIILKDGYLKIYSGGTATNLDWTPGVGTVEWDKDSFVTFVSQYSGVYYASAGQLLKKQPVLTGNIGVSGTVGNYINVFSGGVIESAAIKGNTSLRILNGGIIKNTICENGNQTAWIYMSSGALAQDITVSSYDYLYVYNGGNIDGLILKNSYIGYGHWTFDSNGVGGLYVAHSVGCQCMKNCSAMIEGGTANDIKVYGYADLRISDGGIAMNIIASGWSSNGGCINVGSKGSASNVSLQNSAYLRVYGSGYVENATASSGGYIFISSGGVANNATIEAIGNMCIYKGGIANSTLMRGGYLDVSSGGFANNTIIRGGYLNVSNGGIINNTDVYTALRIYNGGVASSTLINSGYVSISSGGTAKDTTIAGGYLSIQKGGYAQNVTVNSGHSAYVSGVVDGSIINQGGKIYVYSCGIANDATIKSGGSMIISKDGIINNTILDSFATVASFTNIGSDAALIKQIKGNIVTADINGGKFSGTMTCSGNLSVTNTTGNYTLALQQGEYKLSHNDFSKVSFSIAGDASLDLSGNYWGMTDIDAIYEKYGFSKEQVFIENVLLADPTTTFNASLKGLYKNTFGYGTETLTIAFSHEVETSTVSLDSFKLTDKDGNNITINSFEFIDDKTIKLNINAPAEEGRYYLSFANSIKNLAGASLVNANSPQNDSGWADKITLKADYTSPYVTKVSPEHDFAGTFDAFSISFSEAIDGTALNDKVSLIGPDGNTIAATLKTVANGTAYFTVAPQTAYGEYTIKVDNTLTDFVGNLIDQNRNGITGEADDTLCHNFQITNVDLKVADVVLNKTTFAPGEKVTINWNTFNNGGYALSGSWTDGIYLSTDTRWDINDIKLGELVHNGGLAKDQQLANTLDVSLAGVTAGNYYILVRSDIYMQEKGDRESADAAQNLQAVGITVEIPRLEIDKTVSGTLEKKGDFAYYVVHQNANESLNISLDTIGTSSINELFIGYNEVPTRENFDQTLRSVIDGNLLIKAPVIDRDVYIMINARNTNQEDNYNLTVESVELSITSISPALHGNSCDATFDIIGVDFTPECQVKFIDEAGNIYLPAETSYINNQRIKVDFRAGTLVPGQKYDVELANEKETAKLNDAITITGSSGSKFTYGIENLPRNLSPAQTFTFDFSYNNTGVDAMAAPLVIVTAKVGEYEGAMFALDDAGVSRGFWTSTAAEGFSSSVQFLATGTTPGLLQPDPGDMRGVTVPIYYAGWRSTVNNGTNVDYYVTVIESDDTTALDWNEMLKDYSMPDGYKNILAANLTASVGNTWGEYVSMLNNNLAYLDKLDLAVMPDESGDKKAISIDDMFGFELMQNNGVLSPYRTLQSATDMAVTAPGIGLQISRNYNSDLSSRFTESSFGYSWSCNWDMKLEKDSEGNLTFKQSNVSRIYQPNYNFGYQTVAEDGSVMTKTASGYKLTEASGMVYTFDANGTLLTVSDTNGNTITCSYTDGKLTTLTHSSGETLTLTRNEVGYITSVSDTHGNKTSYTYDGNGNLTNVADAASGTSVSYTYGDTHNMTKFTGIDGNSAVYTYNEQGLLSSISTRDGSYKVTLAYGANGELTLKDTQNASQTYYYGDNGLAAKIVDNVSGVTTYFRYDDNDQLISTYDSTGKTAGFTYDEKGNISGIVDELGNKISLVNNDNGTTARMTDVHSNVTEYTYDKKGNLTGTYYADGTCETYTYDNAGNVLTATDVKGGVTTYKYDAQGRVTSSVYNGKTTSYRYDGNSNLSGVTYADGTTSTYAYNGLDLMTKFTDAKSNVTTYSYDNAGNMTGITYANNSTESFAYNTAGDLTQWTNRRGGTVNYTVNALGDTTKVTQSDGTVINYAYDNQGRVISAGNQEYTYNDLDYVTQVSFSDNREINYTYDNLDRVITISDELGHVTNYTYTQYGEIDTMTNEKGKLVVDYDYDNYGRLIKATNGNGTYSTYSYNDYDEVTAIEHFGKDGTLTGFNRYTYNADNLVATKETNEGTWSYTYDKVGQLTSAVLKDTSNNVLRSESYTYDAMGNRTKSESDGVTTTYTYNNMNQIVSANGFAYKYDADGNLLEDEKRTYTWTTDNRVASETDKATGQKWTYTYDALGNRISSTTNGVTTTYTVDANGNVLAEYVNGKWCRSYYRGNNLAGWTSADGEYFFNYDILGSTGSITAKDGSIANTYNYDSFGNITTSTENIANDFEFVGAYGLMSNASGTTFVRARNYDPVIGRWISADPIGISGGENLYVYCGNDGLNYLDISGYYNNVGNEYVSHYGKEVIKSAATEVANNIGGVAGGTAKALEVTDTVQNTFDFGRLLGVWSNMAEHKRDLEQTLSGDYDIEDLERLNERYRNRGQNIITITSDPFNPTFFPPPSYVGDQNNTSHIGSSSYIVSCDPNDKLGNEGYGEENFIAPQTMDYTIRFENDPEWATAPARWVRVYDVLDEDFDLNTFELKSFCLAGNLITIGEGKDSFNQVVKITVAGVEVYVDVKINLDHESRRLSAEFMAIDPATGTMSMDINNGLLWPNDETGRGDGDIKYSITVNEGVENGAKLTNVADIYFDFNEVIETPVVEHTVDSVNPLLSTFSAESEGGNQVTFTLDGTDADSGIKGYNIAYSTDGEVYTILTTVTGNSWTCEIDLQTEYFFKAQAIDNVGNVSDWSDAITVSQNKFTMPENYSEGKFENITLNTTEGILVISNGESAVYLPISSECADIAGLPTDSYRWQSFDGNGNMAASGSLSGNDSGADAFVSQANGTQDVFFAQSSGKWAKGYIARHNGNLVNKWSGTQEQIALTGKNKIEDIFIGSRDSNILILTDDANGDALFLDDIYTNGVTQSRISGIDKIIAGAGDDVIDFTSSRYAYVGTAMEVYGGNGNDTIWMASGKNTLFGDAGNDRIVGGANNDVIVGGIGNDRMHGGGGEDIFCFGENWGNDTVEQLADGEITLWFESGSESSWNASTLTYTDGANSVTVSGVSANNITLIFGDDGSSRYDELADSGCFDDAASEKIFEDKNKGMLA